MPDDFNWGHWTNPNQTRALLSIAMVIEILIWDFFLFNSISFQKIFGHSNCSIITSELMDQAELKFKKNARLHSSFFFFLLNTWISLSSPFKSRNSEIIRFFFDSLTVEHGEVTNIRQVSIELYDSNWFDRSFLSLLPLPIPVCRCWKRSLMQSIWLSSQGPKSLYSMYARCTVNARRWKKDLIIGTLINAPGLK